MPASTNDPSDTICKLLLAAANTLRQQPAGQAGAMMQSVLLRSAAEAGIPPQALGSLLSAVAHQPKVRTAMEELELAANRPTVPPDSGLTPEFSITNIEPCGAEVTGLDLRSQPSDAILERLQAVMADRGFIVFRGQQLHDGDELVAACELFGGRRVHSTHGVHPKAPNRHIFRLSNNSEHGILGVGPQWHNDGSFERRVFSHVGYYIVEAPNAGGETLFAHTGAAFDRLSAADQQRWEALVSVNATSGVVHPLVLRHPISGRKHCYLHLGMTGAVLDTSTGTLLDVKQMRELFQEYNRRLNDPGLHHKHAYRAGDLVMIDNWAVAHKADPTAHDSTLEQGLRILHRVTVGGQHPLDPPSSTGLDSFIDIGLPSPFGPGVWKSGGTGFVWADNIRLQN